MTKLEWKNRLLESGFRCFWCGKPVLDCPEPEADDKAVPDHFIPLSKGGPDCAENVLIACLPCNRLRGNKSFEKFMEERWILAQYQMAKATRINLEQPKTLKFEERFPCFQRLADQKTMDGADKKQAQSEQAKLREHRKKSDRRSA